MRPPDGLPPSVPPSGFPLRQQSQAQQSSIRTQDGTPVPDGEPTLAEMAPYLEMANAHNQQTHNDTRNQPTTGNARPYIQFRASTSEPFMGPFPEVSRPGEPLSRPSSRQPHSASTNPSRERVVIINPRQLNDMVERIRDIIMYKSTLVHHLKEISRRLNITTSGRKADLQERITFTAQQHLANRNAVGIQHMLHIVELFGPPAASIEASRGSLYATTYTQNVNSLGQSPFMPPPTTQRAGSLQHSGSSANENTSPFRGVYDGVSVGSRPASNAQLIRILPNSGANGASRGNVVYGNPSQESSQARQYLPTQNNPIGPGKHLKLLFRTSPFYALHRNASDPVLFMKPHRTRVVQKVMNFEFPALKDNETLFLVCQEYSESNTTPQPMHFPFYFGIELDGKPVKANTRGVRGIEGSAKPVNIKEALLKHSSESKSSKPKTSEQILKGRHVLRLIIHIADAGESTSDRSFAAQLFVGHYLQLNDLIEQLKSREHISFETTQNMARVAAGGSSTANSVKKTNKKLPVLDSDSDSDTDEDDMIAADAVYSLKDNVMMSRMTVPIRSRDCTHIDCFDAESFMMLQTQAETWKCPICNSFVKWESLAVDDYFSKILKYAGPAVSSVTIKSDGSWVLTPDSDHEEDSEDDAPPAKRADRREGEIILLSDDDDNDDDNDDSNNNASQNTVLNEPARNNPAFLNGAPVSDYYSSAHSAFQSSRSSIFQDNEEVVDLTSD